MAMADYHACDLCGAKTFYDAHIDGFADTDGNWRYGVEGIIGHRAYALCGNCEETHEIVIRPRRGVKLVECE